MENTHATGYFNTYDLLQEQVQKFDCNLNRPSVPFTNFDSIKPLYDEENGLHLRLGDNNSFILKLDSYLVKHLIYKKDMTFDEKINEYLLRKNEALDDLLGKLYSLGFEQPSPVQSLTIPFLIQGRDSIVQFKSGTGKTLSFTIGSLFGFDLNDSALQYIFVTVSHEVAEQIYNLVKTLLPDNAKISLCIGNKTTQSQNGGFKQTNSNITRSNSREERARAMTAQVVVGTTGKIYDYMCNNERNQHCFDTRYLKSITIDEFDNMLGVKNSHSAMATSMSTREQIHRMFEDEHFIPRGAQRVFFSATVNEQVLEDCQNFMRVDKKLGPPTNPEDLYNPFLCLLSSEDYTLNGISQYYENVTCDDDKQELLCHIYKNCRVAQSIIFTNTIRSAEALHDYLLDSDLRLNSSIFHGNLTSSQRNTIRDDFISSSIRCLISTDVTARGFDAQGINLVINYDMPNDLATYIHRIGRSGRYGRKGVAINFVMDNRERKINEMQKINEIAKCSNTSKILRLPHKLSDLL